MVYVDYLYVGIDVMVGWYYFVYGYWFVGVGDVGYEYVVVVLLVWVEVYEGGCVMVVEEYYYWVVCVFLFVDDGW